MISNLNEFAFCFWKMGDRGRARQCFRRLTIPLVTESPWCYIDDPITVFKRARERMTG